MNLLNELNNLFLGDKLAKTMNAYTISLETFLHADGNRPKDNNLKPNTTICPNGVQRFEGTDPHVKIWLTRLPDSHDKDSYIRLIRQYVGHFKDEKGNTLDVLVSTHEGDPDIYLVLKVMTKDKRLSIQKDSLEISEMVIDI